MTSQAGSASESSETIRQTRPWKRREEMVRSAWRHAEAGRNDRPAPMEDRGGNRMPKVPKSLVG